MQNFEEYSLDNLVEAMHDVINNTSITGEKLAELLNQELDEAEQQLNEKLQRLRAIRSVIVKRSVYSEPLGNYKLSVNNDDKIDADTLNKLNKSEFYWDKFRNR